MQTIKFEVENSKVDIVLNIIRNLKEDVIKHYEIVSEDVQTKDFIKLSQSSFSKVWDNKKRYSSYLCYF